MTQEQIHNLFKQGYNQVNWKQFLGETFAKARLLANPETLIGIDTNVAKQALKLGTILLDENGIERQIAVYEVTLAKGIILERNRVGLRNLLRKYWKDIDAAFIVYQNTDSKKWRFTYVSELTGYDSEGEFVKIKTEPKRYTYVLGEGESTRTAAERFALIAKKANQATLDDVKEAFSVEKLSKAFFDEYKKHYDIFWNFMMSKPGIRQTIFNGDEKGIRDFNKKLLGRIVFLYFIQKKGWLGVPVASKWGEGNFNFITDLFDHCKNPGLFYSELLSKLFFDTLNSKRKDDLIELVKGQPCRIPYLNGGLFEEDDKKHRNLIFDAQLFKNLFDFFNQYNFTIYEDDPNDHTVAVDPEMLGHIFENLLEDNKDKGAYYTPKEIVHYMCQESLIEYLTTWFENKGYEVVGYIGFDKPDQPRLFSANEGRKGQMILETDHKSTTKQIDRILIEKLLKKKLDDNDKKLVKQHAAEFHNALDNVKICDPAIGSGAFPMGLLHEIYTAKQTLHTFEYGNTTKFDASAVKLNIIQNSIYGVDIEKGAVDIARLRFWLSLIVDEPEPKALPNLDYKIVVGNSLVSKLGETIIDIDWSLNETSHGLFGAELAKQKGDLLKKISAEQKEYFNPNSDKKKLAADIRKLKIDLLINQMQLMVTTKGIEQQPTGNGKAMAKQTEIYLQTLGWKNSIKDLQKLKNKPELPLHFFDWKLDFPEVMNEQIAENVGFDIVIGNPPYINIKNQSEETRSVLKNNFLHAKGADIYVGFLELGFRLLKENKPLAYIIPNKFFGADYGKSIREEINKNKSIIAIWDLKDIKVFENAQISTIVFICSNKRIGYKTKIKTKNTITLVDDVFDQGNKIQIESSDSDKVFLNKIFDNTISLKQIADVRTGVMGFEYWKMEPIINSLGNVSSNNVPIYTNGNCNRYEDFWDTKEITLYKDKYIAPTILLDSNYLNHNTIELFKKAPKIIVRGVSQKVAGFIDKKGCGLLVAVHSIIPNEININLLLALINSKFINWYHLKTFYAIRIPQGSLKYPVEFFNSLPIPKNILKNKIIEDLVSKITLDKSKKQDTFLLEQEIDNLVYKLYELTYDEVKVIDPTFSLSKEEYEAIKLE